MRVACLLLLLALPAPAQDLLVTGGRLFDSVSDAARPNPGVLVRAGKIVALGVERADGAAVLALEETQTLLPGLFDLHAHYAIDLFGRGRRDETRAYPAIFLANGVTSTFSAGEVNPEEMRALRLRVERGEQVGPRIFNSGPYYGTWRKGWDRDMPLDALRAEVDHWAARGVRGFKAKGLGHAHLRVLIERAHHHGLTVTGHLGSGRPGTVNPRDAIALGIDRVEHFLGGDQLTPDRSAYASLEHVDPSEPAFAAICALYVDTRTYFDATLSAFGYFGERDPVVFTPWTDERAYFTPLVQELLKDRPARPPLAQFERIYWKKRATLKRFHELGGGALITTGTDHPSWGDYLQGFSIHRELHCLSLAGLPNADVLKAGTINGARALGVGDHLGSIEPGKWADMIVVAGDVLQDIRATRDVQHVIRGGVVHDPAALLASVQGTIGPRDEGELNDW
jgi:imidazolonepropionase-like amidohydrolase